MNQRVLNNLRDIPSMGNIYYVFNTANTYYSAFKALVDQTYSDGTQAFHTTIESAYAAVTSGRNDVILFDANTSHTLAAMLTVTKSRVNFIGMDGGGRRNSQGAKLQIAAADVAAAVAVIKNQGVRNSFRNIKFIQNGTNSAQLHTFIDEGEGTYVENCSFSHDSLLSTAGVTSLLFAGDTCHYKNCQIGTSTVYRTGAAQYQLKLGNSGTAYARYSYFENCTVVGYSSQTSAACVGTTGAAHVIGWVEFRDCSFINAHLGDGATAGGSFAAAVVSALSSGYILLGGCHSYGATLIASTHASVVNSGPASATTAGGGLGVAGA